MTKLLIFGSSQAASLYFANDALSSHSGLSVDWLVTPANLVFEVDPETQQIAPPASYLRQKRRSSGMQRIGGRDGAFFASDYDMILYSAVGLRPPARLETHPAHALGHMPVSDGLLTAMLANHANIQTERTILQGLRAAGFSGTLLAEQWIRPCALPDGMQMTSWQRFCDAETACLETMAKDLSMSLVPRLDGMEYLTPANHVTHPENSGVHGNASYATAIASSLLSLLEKAPS